MKNNKNIKLIKLCPYCKKENEVYLTPKQFQKYLSYKSGKDMRCIQDVFPELNKETREILKTGICGQCWVEIFK